MDFMISDEKLGNGKDPAVPVALAVVLDRIEGKRGSPELYFSRLKWMVRSRLMREYDFFDDNEDFISRYANALVPSVNEMVKAAMVEYRSISECDSTFTANDTMRQTGLSMRSAFSHRPELLEQVNRIVRSYENAICERMKQETPFEIAVRKHMWFLNKVMLRVFWTLNQRNYCSNIHAAFADLRSGKSTLPCWLFSMVNGEQYQRPEQYYKAVKNKDACACMLELHGDGYGGYDCASGHGFSNDELICEWLNMHVNYPVSTWYEEGYKWFRFVWISHSGGGTDPFPEDKFDGVVKKLTPNLLRGEDPRSFSIFTGLTPLQQCYALEIYVMRNEWCPYGLVHLANAYRKAGHEALMGVVARNALATCVWPRESREVLLDAFPEFVSSYDDQW